MPPRNARSTSAAVKSGSIATSNNSAVAVGTSQSGSSSSPGNAAVNRPLDPSPSSSLNQSILLQQEGLTWANISQHLNPDLSSFVADSAAMDMSLNQSKASSNNNNGMDNEQPVLNREDQKMFGYRPLYEDLVLVQCPECHKNLLPSSFTEHLDRCKNPHKHTPVHQHENSGSSSMNAQNPEDVVKRKRGRQPKKNALLDQNMFSTVDDNQHSSTDLDDMEILSSNSNRKYRDPIPGLELRRKVARIVNLDMQCGVFTTMGVQCTRPLNCHIHSMHAKSLVPGRSKNFHSVMKEYLKKLMAEENAAGGGADSDDVFVDIEDPFSAHIASSAAESTKFNKIVDEKILDADKDIDKLVALIQHHVSEPLVKPQFVQFKRQTTTLRLRDFFLNALGKVPVQPNGNPMGAMSFTKAPLNTALGPMPPMSEIQQATSGTQDQPEVLLAVKTNAGDVTAASTAGSPTKKKRSAPRKSTAGDKGRRRKTQPQSRPISQDVVMEDGDTIGIDPQELFGS